MAEWLTITDAAHRLGWHPRKLESRARRERWPRRAANRGRAGEYLIPAGLLAGVAETAPPPAGHDAANGAAADAATAKLANGSALTHGSERLVELVAELRHELARAVERAAHAEGKAEVLAVALAKAEGRADQLAAELARAHERALEARTPLVLRLLRACRRR